MTDENLGTLITGAVGAGLTGIAWVARWWWAQKREQRSDAVDAANAHVQVNMLESAERRAKEAEAEADRERNERLKIERALMQAEAKLYVAASDIVRLERRLERAGVPHSDYGKLIETNFGHLPEPDGGANR
jgi:alpha-beta hydrolase superfamily lysophospholipase